MTDRRSKFLNKKCKSISEGLFFTITETTSETDHVITPMERMRELCRKGKAAIDVKRLDASLRRECIEMAYEFNLMNSAERISFLFEDPNFPREEKLMMLNACTRVMEQMEEFEVCETLKRMRSILARR